MPIKRVGFAKPDLPIAPRYKAPVNPDPNHYSNQPSRYNGRKVYKSDDSGLVPNLATGFGAAATVASALGPAVFNPYVATGLAVTGAALTGYSVAKALYHAIF